MPSSTWDNLPHGKQLRVVQAAASEFAAHGFSSGSLNVIAKEAGVAKGSLFQYFDDKLDLFRHVYADLARGTREAMEVRTTAHLAAGAPIFDVLRLILVDFIEFHRENPLEGAILRAMTFEPAADVRVVLREVVDQHYIDLIGLVVELARADGQLREGADLPTLKASVHTMFMHLGVAGISPEMNPFVPLHALEGDELRTAITAFVAPLQAYYGAPNDPSA